MVFHKSTLLLVIGICLFISVSGQTLPEQVNEVDENGSKQGEWVIYFDENWEETSDTSSVAFYRVLTYQNGKVKGTMVDFYRSGKPQMELDSVIQEDPLIPEGQLRLFTESGRIHLVEVYQSGVMDTTATMEVFNDLLQRYKREIPNHLDLALLANDYAYLFRVQGRYERAINLYDLCFNIRKDQLGNNHVLYANTCSKLGWTYMQMDKLSHAQLYFMEAIRVYKLNLGVDSEEYITSRDHLATIYRKQGKEEAANRLYR